jgi:hypothetical protein
MPKGLLNHNHEQNARDRDPHAAAAPLEDENVDEISEDETFELDFADEDDPQAADNDTLAASLLFAAETESLVAATRGHPIRAIEALLEAKRLDAMLREVYEDD